MTLAIETPSPARTRRPRATRPPRAVPAPAPEHSWEASGADVIVELSLLTALGPLRLRPVTRLLTLTSDEGTTRSRLEVDLADARVLSPVPGLGARLDPTHMLRWALGVGVDTPWVLTADRAVPVMGVHYRVPTSFLHHDGRAARVTLQARVAGRDDDTLRVLSRGRLRRRVNGLVLRGRRDRLLTDGVGLLVAARLHRPGALPQIPEEDR